MLSNMVSRLRKHMPASVLVLGTLVLSTLQIGCAAPESALLSSSGLPVENASRAFQVREYALVEASTDNPDHAAFQEYALEAVSARRSAWPFSGSGDAIQGPNQALAPFGYHLAANPSPPFSGFALYHSDQLVQRDIARFWPVSIKTADHSDGLGDFVLSYETMNGEKLVASSEGIQPWPGQEQPARGLQKPVDRNQVAYAGNAVSGINLFAGAPPLYEAKPAADMFGWQVVGGQPFYFYIRGDLVHLNYAGQDLAYVYDQVVHNNTGGNAIFNPGGTGQVSWFYAIRDGLWYYVEAGLFH